MKLDPETTRKHEGRAALSKACRNLRRGEAPAAIAAALTQAYGEAGAWAIAQQVIEIIDMEQDG